MSKSKQDVAFHSIFSISLSKPEVAEPEVQNLIITYACHKELL